MFTIIIYKIDKIDRKMDYFYYIDNSQVVDFIKLEETK